MELSPRKSAGGKGRRVGVAFERKIIERLGLWWAGDSRSLYRSHGSGSRPTLLGFSPGLYSGDVMPVKDVAHPWPFSIEIKKSEKFTLESILLSKKSLFYSFWQQCLRDSKKSQKIPLLICGRKYTEPLVFFYASYQTCLLQPPHGLPFFCIYPGGAKQRSLICTPMTQFFKYAKREYILDHLAKENTP